MQKVCDILTLCTHMAPVPWDCVASSVLEAQTVRMAPSVTPCACSDLVCEMVIIDYVLNYWYKDLAPKGFWGKLMIHI